MACGTFFIRLRNLLIGSVQRGRWKSIFVIGPTVPLSCVKSNKINRTDRGVEIYIKSVSDSPAWFLWTVKVTRFWATSTDKKYCFYSCNCYVATFNSRFLVHWPYHRPVTPRSTQRVCLSLCLVYLAFCCVRLFWREISNMLARLATSINIACVANSPLPSTRPLRCLSEQVAMGVPPFKNQHGEKLLVNLAGRPTHSSHVGDTSVRNGPSVHYTLNPGIIAIKLKKNNQRD